LRSLGLGAADAQAKAPKARAARRVEEEDDVKRMLGISWEA